MFQKVWQQLMDAHHPHVLQRPLYNKYSLVLSVQCFAINGSTLCGSTLEGRNVLKSKMPRKISQLTFLFKGLPL
jgi:hypothetical protein